LPPLAPAWDTRKYPLTVTSVWAAASVLRALAVEPAVALSDSCAAKDPALTVALWTLAAPPPAATTWVQAEKSPDSNPSLNKTVSALAAPAPSSATPSTGRAAKIAASGRRRGRSDPSLNERSR